MVLRQKPTGGAVFAFCEPCGDRVKLLYFDGQRFCLYYKILQKGRFSWPSDADGTDRGTVIERRDIRMPRLKITAFLTDPALEYRQTSGGLPC